MPIPLIPFRRPTQKLVPLPVVMSGARAGERVLQIGIDEPAIAGAIAGKPGMNGRSAFVVADDRDAARARKAAADAMTLADVEIAPPTRLPFEDAAFDLVVVHARTGAVAALDADGVAAMARDALRTLRPGGRVVVLAPGTPVGLKAMLRSQSADGRPDVEATLRRIGYQPVRVLADKEGYLFTEGLKPKA